MPDPHPSEAKADDRQHRGETARLANLRQHRDATDRNALLGFFGILFILGGGLIFAFYGPAATVLGVACLGMGAVLAGLVLFIMFGLQKFSDWLEERD